MASNNDDPRLGSLLEVIPWSIELLESIQQQQQKSTVVLVGFPFDIGVIRNGGVPGTREGPSALRVILHKLGTTTNPEVDPDVEIGKYVRVIDSGDVTVEDENALEQAHAELSNRVAALIQANAIPFVVGGGNDQSYANFCGLRDSKKAKSVSVVNIDAHLDVR
jgi:formiminoglutamase